MISEEKVDILLVDDLMKNIIALEAILDNPKINIMKATSGDEALSLMLEHDFALVLLDVQMPKLDGFEVARLMRGSKKTRYIPIIFITAINKDPDNVFKGYEAGAVDYLFKPIDPKLLISKVNVFLEIHQQKKLLERQTQLLNKQNEELKQSKQIFKMMMRENEKLLGKTIEHDKLQTQFFSNMSHEFKTPLNVTLGIVQLLKSCSKDNEILIRPKEFNRYVNLMKQNCYRLLRLINNLIDITRIDSDFLKIHLKNCNLVSIVESVTLSVVDFAENKGVSLIFDTETEEKVVACDVDAIERIMLNVLSNAIKHTKDGGNITVTIYDKDEHVIISVKDTGKGIPKDQLENIFQRFRQVDSSFRRETEGSGIGLALVKSLVEKHEGEIWAESEIGLGTEIFIKFPTKILPEGYESLDYEAYENHLVERIHIEFSDIYEIG